jgi:hypothetical protein
MSSEDSHPHVGDMDDPVISIIAAAPDEVVPQGVPLELVHLPSLDTDEVKSWVEHNRTGPVFVAAGVDIASEGTLALPVTVTEEEYHALLSAMPF